MSRKTLIAIAVTPEEFREAYPKLRAWIQKTLASYEKAAQPIASMHFVRLPLYSIIVCSTPPLSALGLGRFADFEQGNFDGITYLDRYFIKHTRVTEESLHLSRSNWDVPDSRTHVRCRGQYECEASSLP